MPRMPRLLDLGAGTGRIGWPFAAAGDDYVGVDLSFAMLRAFRERVGRHEAAPCLVQSDGQLLPFRDAAFDAVLMVQIFGGLRGWRRLLAEARRVLRPDGALILGRSIAPDDGVDTRMKAQLASFLEAMAAVPGTSAREDAQRWLEAAACNTSSGDRGDMGGRAQPAAPFSIVTAPGPGFPRCPNRSRPRRSPSLPHGPRLPLGRSMP